MSGSLDLRATRLFFLDTTPDEGRPRLAPEDERHAVRVLRLSPGDELTGTDGRGRAWPLRVSAAGRGGLELEVAGALRVVPAPGEEQAGLPWVEVAVALPRGGRTEEMLDRLVQLGIAALTPLVSERVQGPLREVSPMRLERLARTAREACKQCKRLWLPEIREPLRTTQLPDVRQGAWLAVLDPAAALDVLEWSRGLVADDGAAIGTRERPLVVVVGPEGGLTEDERAGLRERGACEVRLGPHLLRIETAAEAAVACLILARAGVPGSVLPGSARV